MNEIINYIRGIDPVIMLLLGGGLILVLPSLKPFLSQVVDLFKNFTKREKPVVPPPVVEDPSILDLVKEWEEFYRLCKKSGLDNACEKLDEVWHLLRKDE
ncbi:MAG: hypothetical protein HWN81_09250 [Candidatus Lokiarchaeota archaeon]|jgi:hypothetical protein|nr:hypothetical protein [Candidatus Lokiarchaeota archaeon]